MSRRILVTGASGMLGSRIVRDWSRRHDVWATARNRPVVPVERFLAFDLESTSYAPLVQWAAPDVIVHCAAWTDVDACERDAERALAINGESVARLCAAAPHARIFYISTDAVFGEDERPAREQTPAAPLNAYARGKRLGETRLLAAAGAHCVVRTTIVGLNAPGQRASFAGWIVTSVRRRERIRLFADALFSPISCARLAAELEWMIDQPQLPAMLHVSGAESCSKLEFGRRLVSAIDGDVGLITEAHVADARFAAPRARDQRLDCAAYQSLSSRSLPTIDDTIHDLVEELAAT